MSARRRARPIRLAVWLLFTATIAAAQEKPAETLSELRETAEKKAADWEGLAKTLEPRVARMLPCDPRVRAAIEEVSRASEVRLAAFAQYLQAAAAKAKEDAETARLILANQETRAADMEAERAETELARAGIDVQMTGLSGSVKQRPALEDALKNLRELAALAASRASRVQEHTGRRTALTATLRDLAAASQAAQSALDNELNALRNEAARWSEYYTLRLARAQYECAITNQAPSTRPSQRKKGP